MSEGPNPFAPPQSPSIAPPSQTALATPGARLLAHLLDTLLAQFSAVLAAMVVAVVAGQIIAPEYTAFPVLLTLLAVAATYYVASELLLRATPGKLAVGIQVSAKAPPTGGAAAPRAIVLRNAIKLPLTMLFGPLAGVTVFLPEHPGPWDAVAGTSITQHPERSAVSNTAGISLAVGLMAMMLLGAAFIVVALTELGQSLESDFNEVERATRGAP